MHNFSNLESLANDAKIRSLVKFLLIQYLWIILEWSLTFLHQLWDLLVFFLDLLGIFFCSGIYKIFKVRNPIFMFFHQLVRLSLGVISKFQCLIKNYICSFHQDPSPNPLRTIKITECDNNTTEYMEIFFTLKAISGLEVKQKQLNLASNIFPPSHLLSSL